MAGLLDVFHAVANLAIGAKARRDEEYREFLTFYRSLVETIPTAAVSIFGNMDVEVFVSGKPTRYGIEITATDFLWWKSSIENDGTRFTTTPAAVQREMLNRLSRQAETQGLSPDERKALLALIDQSVA